MITVIWETEIIKVQTQVMTIKCTNSVKIFDNEKNARWWIIL